LGFHFRSVVHRVRRTELLPIKKTAEGVAKYVGKHVAKHIGQRLPEDKGARLVRYSHGTNRASTGFAWNSHGAYMWRAKLGAFCRMLGLNSDNYQTFLKEWFGRNWVYPTIEDRLPDRFVLGVKQGVGFRLVLGAQAELLAGGGVLAVEHPRAPEQDKPLFHDYAFLGHES
jgi:hypothetical protein